MTWKNNRISFTHLNAWWSCHRSFNLTMLSEPPRLAKIIKQGADFGIKAEKFWDSVFEENWFAKERTEVEDLLNKGLLVYGTEDALKIREGFWKCFDQMTQIFGEEGFTHLELQKELYLETPPYLSYGKLDYFLRVNGVPYIIDAKGTSAKDKKHAAQILHYSYMHWKNTQECPKGYVFYLRRGWVAEHTFSEEVLKRYGRVLDVTIAQIKSLRDYEESVFEAKVNPGCFVCGYAHDCDVKIKADELKSQAQYVTDVIEDELLI